MKGIRVEKIILRVGLILSLISLLILLRRKKAGIKDWLLAYLANGFTNGIIDHILVTYKVLKYPVRYFPKIFKVNVLFDFLIYPTFTVFFNQWTAKDKRKTILFKLLILVAPTTLFEYIIENKTDLLKWKKGWKWYHTFVSVTLKSLATRALIGFIKKVSDK